ncbi:MAG: hypothetical protein Salg2KO_08370 [Salibacteraceae bacterium]
MDLISFKPIRISFTALATIVMLCITSTNANAQCTLYDGTGTAVANPVWVSCSGGAYTLFIQSPNTFGPLTINWGDGSANTTVGSLVPPAFISHTYAAAINNYTVTVTETGGNNCVITGLVVMEEPVNASIQIPIGGVTQACAPATLIFQNSSTDVSSTTTFEWDFGDGSPIEVYGDTNAGQIISHTYEQNTVNCVTTVTLAAENYCSFGNPTTAQFNPIQIYDIDDAAIAVDAPVKCYPDTVFHFDNNTNKNCLPQGNNQQRFEYWNFGNYWGLGQDSIIDWLPFDPPGRPGYDIAFPGLGTYTIMMIDSSLCGLDTALITVQITSPPTAGFTMSTDSSCTGVPVTFTRTSSAAPINLINFDDGGGFQAFGANTTYSYPNAGNYTVSVVASTVAGSPACSDTAELNIEILPSPTASANISPNGGCDSVTSIFLNSSLGAVSYFWNFGGGDTSTLQTPAPRTFSTPGLYTISLSVLSANGCPDSTTAIVNVYDTPTADFSALNVCEDELANFYDSSTVGYGGPINSWSWFFGDSLNSTSNVQNPTFTYIDSGTYVITLIAATAYCQDTLTDTLVVEPRPIAAFQESDSVGCSPVNVNFNNLSAFGATAFWEFGDGATSTALNPSHTYTHSGLTDTTYIVKLVSYSAFGCVDSVFDTIIVRGNPTADFTSDATLDCAPLQVQFTDASTGASSLLWDFGDTTGSTLTNPSHIFENTTQFITNYTVTLIATAPNGCTDTASEVVTVYPEPLFGFSIVPDSGCSPLVVQFPVAIGAVLYQWDFGDGNTSTGPNPTHTYINNTTNNQNFTVQLIATSPFGCVDTVQGEVTVFPIPTANLTPALSFGCSPLSVAFTNGSTGGTTYSWDFDDGTQFVSNNIVETHSFSNTTNDTLFYTPKIVAETPQGCKDSAFVSVQVYRRVEASFTTDTAICHPNNASFTDLSINPNQWNWNFDDGFNSIAQNPTHTFVNFTPNPIVRSVFLEVVSIEGCSDDTTIDVTVNPKPLANFVINNSPSCNEQPVVINNTSQQNVINTWRFFNSGVPVVINEPQIDTAFVNNGSNPQEFNIILAVENAFGCSDTVTKEMTVFPRVTASFTGLDEGCAPFEVPFTNNSSGGNLHAWDFGDGNISFEDDPIHVFDVSGTIDEVFDVRLITTSPYGCNDTDFYEVLVHPTPEPLFTINPVQQRYPDTTVSITNLTTGPWQYDWEFGDGETAITFAPVEHRYLGWGKFRIRLSVYSEFCEDTTSLPLVIEPPFPIANFDTLVDDCAPVSFQFNNLSQYAESYLWEFGDGATSSSENPIHTYQFAGSYTVKLTVTGPGGDVDEFEVQNAVVVRNQPVANFVYSPGEVNVPNPVIFVNYSQFADSYLWDFGDSTSSTEANPQKSYQRGGQYFPLLIAETTFGCIDSFRSEVPIIAIEQGRLEIPNAFTPQSGGGNGGIYDPLATNNAIFFPVLTGVASEEYTLSIFNRWGELLFETHDVRQGWDGYYRDEECPQDVYVWKMRGEYVNGEKFSKVGDVTLIK